MSELIHALAVYSVRVRTYETPALQNKALQCIPVERIRLEAREAISLAEELGGEAPNLQDEVAKGLLLWFKNEFFSWVHQPECWKCGSSGTKYVGNSTPSSEHLKFGANRVEVYLCPACKAQTEFPRYDDPGKLLETRKGRCGEWANAFTLCCRAMGIEARLVLDRTDHVWTECFSEEKNRWVHLDPCEGVYDNPLLYESGWGKKLTYNIGFDRYGATDVTRRYTRHYEDVLKRRVEIEEDVLEANLTSITADSRAGLDPGTLAMLESRDLNEVAELLQNKDEPDKELPGRQTGSDEWRTSRGESGSSTAERPPGTPFRKVRIDRDRPAYVHGILLCGGAARASGENLGAGETCEKAFDGRTDTKWLDFGGAGTGSAWLEYCLLKQQGSAQLASYAVVSGNDAPERDPCEWTLLGLVDETDSWKVLDRRAGFAFEERGQRVQFDVASGPLCTKFKLCISRVREASTASCVQLAGLELFAVKKENTELSGENSSNVKQEFKKRLAEEFEAKLKSGVRAQEAILEVIEKLSSDFAGKIAFKA